MPKRSSKNQVPPEDENVSAFDAVQRLTGQAEPDEYPEGKNPAAVYLGRLGGKKGGPARAKKLSKKRMKEIAREGARARWKKAGKKGKKR